jgi:hypothetical protein
MAEGSAEGGDVVQAELHAEPLETEEEIERVHKKGKGKR